MPEGGGPAVGTRTWAVDRLRSALGDAFEAVSEALDFAADCHEGQVRLVRPGMPTVPYLEHPVGVALLCDKLWESTRQAVPSRETLLRVALLHDVIEDCAVSVDDLEARFGAEVAAHVLALSKPPMREGESADDRMRRFTAQMADAGPAAVFVKACDLIHNLSRPETTPANVIRRASERGRRYYLPMIESAGLGDRLGTRVLGALRAADTAASPTGIPASGEESRLHLALLQAIRGKLEIHDADRLLREICNLGESLVVRFSRRGRPTVVSGRLASNLDAGRLAHIRNLTREAGGVVRLAPKWLQTGKPDPRSTPGGAFAALDSTFDGGETLVVWSLPAGYETAMPPGFSAQAVLLLVLAVISKPASRRHRDIAKEALSLGIELDLGLVDELGIQRGHLRKLARWRQLCDVAGELVEAELRYFVHSQERRGPLWHRVRIERRTKTVPSILRKYASQHALKWPNFAALEDIGGIRVICPTSHHVAACVAYFERSVVERPLRGPLRRYDLEPTADGYRGVHAIRDVRLPGEAVAVPCEVQIRTLFQDAWSTLSHTVAYKLDGDEARQRRLALRRLSEQLHECERAADAIFPREARSDTPPSRGSRGGEG